jgi:hypothetical protein
MSDLLTAYVLVWPVIVGASLAVMCAAVARDVQRARRDDDSLV